MLKGAIARRYAGAMFDLALKQNALSARSTMCRIWVGFSQKHTLAYLLREPRFPGSAKRRRCARWWEAVCCLFPSIWLCWLFSAVCGADARHRRELQQMVFDYRNQAIADVTLPPPGWSAAG